MSASRCVSSVVSSLGAGLLLLLSACSGPWPGAHPGTNDDSGTGLRQGKILMAPDGRHFLLSAAGDEVEQSGLFVGDLIERRLTRVEGIESLDMATFHPSGTGVVLSRTEAPKDGQSFLLDGESLDDFLSLPEAEQQERWRAYFAKYTTHLQALDLPSARIIWSRNFEGHANRPTFSGTADRLLFINVLQTVLIEPETGAVARNLDGLDDLRPAFVGWGADDRLVVHRLVEYESEDNPATYELSVRNVVDDGSICSLQTRGDSIRLFADGAKALLSWGDRHQVVTIDTCHIDGEFQGNGDVLLLEDASRAVVWLERKEDVGEEEMADFPEEVAGSESQFHLGIVSLEDFETTWLPVPGEAAPRYVGSPDGARLVLDRATPELQIVDVATATIREASRQDVDSACSSEILLDAFAFAPDSARMFFLSCSRLRELDFVTGTHRHVFDDGVHWRTLASTPDARTLLLRADHGASVWLFDVETRRLRGSITP